MLRRILSFAAAAAVLVTLVYREETRGTFLPIEESYLELLMTSSGREPPAPDITFLPVTDDARRAGNPIYSTWPPAPMDYALLLQSLARYTPGSVAVSAEFSWDEPDPLSVPILKERISAFPSLLLAIDLEGGSPPPVAAPLPPQTIGIIPAKNIGGQLGSLPAYTHLSRLPDPRISSADNVRFAHKKILFENSTPKQDGQLRVPLLARANGGVLPSFPLSMIIMEHGITTDQIQVEIGHHIKLPDDTTIPIDEMGMLVVPEDIRNAVRKADADTLFLDPTSELLDSESGISTLTATKEHLVYLGADGQNDRNLLLSDGSYISQAELFAMAVATVQTGHFIERFPREIQFGIWGTILAFGVYLLTRRWYTALWQGLLFLLLYISAGYLAFRFLAVWWPLTPPVCLIIFGILAALFLPDGRKKV